MDINWENVNNYDWNDINIISNVDWLNAKWDKISCRVCKTNTWYKFIDWNNKELVKSIIKYDWEDFQFCSETLKNDYDITYLAVSDYGLALYWASDELKNNINIVKKAISTYAYSYKYSSNTLMENKEIIDFALNKNPDVYQYIPKKYQQDYNYAFLAVSNNWKNYKDIIKNIKGLNKNKDIINEALSQSQEVLNFIPDKIKHHFDV